MEYESSKERLSTNPSLQVTGKKIPKEKRDKVISALQDGQGTSAVVEATGVSKATVLAIRKDTEDNQGFELGTWKKQTANLLSQIVTKGSTRLLDAIDDIPAGQLPLAIAIMVDKVAALQDAPTVIVEHRLRVSHEDINSMLKGDIVDIKPLEQKDLTQ
jgi:threonine dehydrogenase-like Zn-dependent dehydrogenase